MLAISNEHHDKIYDKCDLCWMNTYVRNSSKWDTYFSSVIDSSVNEPGLDRSRNVAQVVQVLGAAGHFTHVIELYHAIVAPGLIYIFI